MKEAIQEIHYAIEKYSSRINNKEKEDDLQHDGLVAEEKVKEWKAHILRVHNQEQCKQSILLLFSKTKFLYYLTGQMEIKQKANRVVCKERHKLAYLQCHFQERREARSLLLRSPVEQL